MTKTSSGVEVNYRIGTTSAAFLYGFGALGWFMSFLLTLTGIGIVVVWILNVIGQIIYITWYGLHGVSYVSGRASQKIGVLLAGTSISAIPGLNGLIPTFLIQTALIIHITRAEDREKAELGAQAIA